MTRQTTAGKITSIERELLASETRLTGELKARFAVRAKLEKRIRKNLKGLGHGL